MLTESLLLEDQVETPLASRQSFSMKNNVLKRHESITLEQYVATHPLRPEDVVYPTNMALGGYEDVGEDDRNIQEVLEGLPGQRLASLVTMAVFAGYACLFSMQHMIKMFFEIPDDDSAESHSFSYTITAMYISNLIFRLGQNVLLGALSPRQRAFIGLAAMTVSMLLLGVKVFWLNQKQLSTVTFAYALGGVAIGTFETNFSVVLAALGTKTKVYGISGIPLGIFIVIVPGFIAVTAGCNIVYIYLLVAGLLIVGGLVLICGLRYPEIDEKRLLLVSSSSSFRKNQKVQWIIPVLSLGTVFSINMLFVSAFSPGVLLYLYNQPQINLLFLPSPLVVPTGYFFAVFSSLGFFADVLSRKRIYTSKPLHHPVGYLLLTALGVSILTMKKQVPPFFAPFATFLIFFANGSIYAQACRKLDHLLVKCDPSLLVVANSVFFFLGDCGSVIGALLIPFIRDLLSDT